MFSDQHHPLKPLISILVCLLIAFALTLPHPISAQTRTPTPTPPTDPLPFDTPTPPPTPILEAEVLDTVRWVDVGWSPDGQLLAASSNFFTVMLAQDLAPIWQQTARLGRLTWSPDSSRIASFGVGKTLVVIDATQSSEIWSIPPEDAHTLDLAWSPDGEQIARLMWEMASSNEMVQRVRLYNADDGTLLLTTQPLTMEVSPPYAHAMLVWNGDSTQIAVIAPRTDREHHPIYLFETRSGTGAELAVSSSVIFDLAWHPALGIAALSTHALTIYDPETGEIENRFALDTASDFDLAPDGKYAAIATNGSVTLLDLARDERTIFVPRNDSLAWQVAWSSQNVLATLPQEGALQTWDVSDPTNPREIAAWVGE